MYEKNFNEKGRNVAVNWDSLSVDSRSGIATIDVLIVNGSKNGETEIDLGTAWTHLTEADPDKFLIRASDPRKVHIDYRRRGEKTVLTTKVSKENVQRLNEYADEVLANLPEVPKEFQGWYGI